MWAVCSSFKVIDSWICFRFLLILQNVCRCVLGLEDNSGSWGWSRDKNWGGGEYLCSHPGALVLTCTMGYWSWFLGVKQLGRGVDHPPPSSTELKGGIELYLFSTRSFMTCYRVNLSKSYRYVDLRHRNWMSWSALKFWNEECVGRTKQLVCFVEFFHCGGRDKMGLIFEVHELLTSLLS